MASLAPKDEEVDVPPSDTEKLLLKLFQGHLESNEQAMKDMTLSIKDLGGRIDATSSRVFYLAVAILLVLAAATGSNVYASWGGGTVSLVQSGDGTNPATSPTPVSPTDAPSVEPSDTRTAAPAGGEAVGPEITPAGTAVTPAG